MVGYAIMWQCNAMWHALWQSPNSDQPIIPKAVKYDRNQLEKLEAAKAAYLAPLAISWRWIYLPDPLLFVVGGLRIQAGDLDVLKWWMCSVQYTQSHPAHYLAPPDPISGQWSQAWMKSGVGLPAAATPALPRLNDTPARSGKDQILCKSAKMMFWLGLWQCGSVGTTQLHSSAHSIFTIHC